ncbi:hypothetical protein Nizo3400_2803 [Lactiplantibacillus plantarum]|nr:hypothetical protein Nizo3400_2803 [Lactiplantibacillus plantarum]
MDSNLNQVIGDHLLLSWSPKTIAHEFKLLTKSIYKGMAKWGPIFF